MLKRVIFALCLTLALTGPALAECCNATKGVTQLKVFSATGVENFPKLEQQVDDWLAAKGDSIRPVNSQTAICAIADGGDGKQSQAVIISLWYIASPERKPHN